MYGLQSTVALRAREREIAALQAPVCPPPAWRPRGDRNGGSLDGGCRKSQRCVGVASVPGRLAPTARAVGRPLPLAADSFGADSFTVTLSPQPLTAAPERRLFQRRPSLQAPHHTRLRHHTSCTHAGALPSRRVLIKFAIASDNGNECCGAVQAAAVSSE